MSRHKERERAAHKATMLVMKAFERLAKGINFRMRINLNLRSFAWSWFRNGYKLGHRAGVREAKRECLAMLAKEARRSIRECGTPTHPILPVSRMVASSLPAGRNQFPPTALEEDCLEKCQ